MRFYGKGLSDASKSAYVDQYSANAAQNLATPGDSFHRAKAQEHVLNMADQGLIDINDDSRVNPILEDSYLRSKTGGKIGSNAAMFDRQSAIGPQIGQSTLRAVQGLNPNTLQAADGGVFAVGYGGTSNETNKEEVLTEGKESELAKIKAKTDLMDAARKAKGSDINYGFQSMGDPYNYENEALATGTKYMNAIDKAISTGQRLTDEDAIALGFTPGDIQTLTTLQNKKAEIEKNMKSSSLYADYKQSIDQGYTQKQEAKFKDAGNRNISADVYTTTDNRRLVVDEDKNGNKRVVPYSEFETRLLNGESKEAIMDGAEFADYGKVDLGKGVGIDNYTESTGVNDAMRLLNGTPGLDKETVANYKNGLTEMKKIVDDVSYGSEGAAKKIYEVNENANGFWNSWIKDPSKALTHIGTAPYEPFYRRNADVLGIKDPTPEEIAMQKNVIGKELMRQERKTRIDKARQTPAAQKLMDNASKKFSALSKWMPSNTALSAEGKQVSYVPVLGNPGQFMAVIRNTNAGSGGPMDATQEPIAINIWDGQQTENGYLKLLTALYGPDSKETRKRFNEFKKANFKGLVR